MPKHLNIPEVFNADQLLHALRAADLEVPSRSDGRVAQDVERWTGAQVLAALAAAERLEFPLCLKHADKPDFQLCAGTALVGIEVTEAISPTYAACCALRDREYSNCEFPPPIPMTEFAWDAKRMSVDRMRNILDAVHLRGLPVPGGRLEADWVAYFRGMLEAKTVKCLKAGFQRLPQNWLAVHDNLPLSGDLLEGAIVQLMRDLDWSSLAFDRVLVEHSRVVAVMTSRNVEFISIPEL